MWDVLLDGMNTDEQHRGADEAAFRLTYPFSPALISMLRSLAGVMQRERTALKVMQHMLVDRRGTLTIDDVIPVGDAFDYVVDGSEVLDARSAALFKAAAALYRDKLRPLLLGKYGLAEADLTSPEAAPAGFRADDRLVKTLLLSAVAPNVPALKEMTASRLASLNHGSIRSPLPGQEASTVLGKVREWAVQVPEIHVAPGQANPVIRVRLSDVDYESIVERVRREDNDGRRRELIRELVREAFGIGDRDADLQGAVPHPVIWRGSRREVDIVFGNVRDPGWLSDDHFRARQGTWRVVIDFPFDLPGHSSAEDLARLDRLMAGGLQSQTIAWLPRFLSDERMRDVRRLVVLDWLLGGPGERWTGAAEGLSTADRVQARAILDSQRAGLRDKLRRVIQECYGAAAPTIGNLAPDGADERILVSLDPNFTPAAPVGADLGAAFGNLTDQAFSATFPGHPRFEPADAEIAVRDLAAVYQHITRAVADPDGRVRLEGDISAVRRVANVLGVGYAGETHFLFGDDRFMPWNMELERSASRAGVQLDDSVRAEQVREWIQAIRPRLGLRPEVADLIILAWAALRQRAWFQAGTAIPAPRPGAVRTDYELRPEPLPAARRVAGRRVARRADLRPAREPVPDRGGRRRTRARPRRPGSRDRRCQRPAGRHHRDRLPAPGDHARATAGCSTARAGSDLTESLRRAPDGLTAIRALAGAELPGTEAALAKSISQAARVAAALDDFRWERLAPLRAAAARAGSAAARRAPSWTGSRKRSPQTSSPSRSPAALERAEQAIFDWLAAGQPRRRRQATTPAQPEPLQVAGGTAGAPARPGRPGGQAVRARGTRPDAVLAELRSFLDEHGDDDVVVEWRVGE